MVTPEFDGANCIDLLIIRASEWLETGYLLKYLNSWSARADVQYRSVGAIQSHYNTSTLGNLSAPVPPLEEQRAILAAIDDEIVPIAKATSATLAEIALLREYRTRLIADVVTGKLDVREAAARLPEEAAEPEPLDEIPADEDMDEVAVDETDALPEEVES